MSAATGKLPALITEGLTDRDAWIREAGARYPYRCTEVSAMIAEYDATTFDSATDGLDFLAQLVETLRPALGTELVLFNWSRDHGDCSDCGLPAAFLSVDAYGEGQDQPLCSRCAANHAADGATIDRIEVTR